MASNSRTRISELRLVAITSISTAIFLFVAVLILSRPIDLQDRGDFGGRKHGEERLYPDGIFRRHIFARQGVIRITQPATTVTITVEPIPLARRQAVVVEGGVVPISGGEPLPVITPTNPVPQAEISNSVSQEIMSLEVASSVIAELPLNASLPATPVDRSREAQNSRAAALQDELGIAKFGAMLMQCRLNRCDELFPRETVLFSVGPDGKATVNGTVTNFPSGNPTAAPQTLPLNATAVIGSGDGIGPGVITAPNAAAVLGTGGSLGIPIPEPTIGVNATVTGMPAGIMPSNGTVFPSIGPVTNATGFPSLGRVTNSSGLGMIAAAAVNSAACPSPITITQLVSNVTFTETNLATITVGEVTVNIPAPVETAMMTVTATNGTIQLVPVPIKGDEGKDVGKKGGAGGGGGLSLPGLSFGGGGGGGGDGGGKQDPVRQTITITETITTTSTANVTELTTATATTTLNETLTISATTTFNETMTISTTTMLNETTTISTTTMLNETTTMTYNETSTTLFNTTTTATFNTTTTKTKTKTKTKLTTTTNFATAPPLPDTPFVLQVFLLDEVQPSVTVAPGAVAAPPGPIETAPPIDPAIPQIDPNSAPPPDVNAVPPTDPNAIAPPVRRRKRSRIIRRQEPAVEPPPVDINAAAPPPDTNIPNIDANAPPVDSNLVSTALEPDASDVADSESEQDEPETPIPPPPPPSFFLKATNSRPDNVVDGENYSLRRKDTTPVDATIFHYYNDTGRLSASAPAGDDEFMQIYAASASSTEGTTKQMMLNVKEIIYYAGDVDYLGFDIDWVTGDVSVRGGSWLLCGGDQVVGIGPVVPREASPAAIAGAPPGNPPPDPDVSLPQDSNTIVAPARLRRRQDPAPPPPPVENTPPGCTRVTVKAVGV